MDNTRRPNGFDRRSSGPPPLPFVVTPDAAAAAGSSAKPPVQWEGRIGRATRMLTETECAFWSQLAAVVDRKRCIVLSKCRLSDVCWPLKKLPMSEKMRLRGHMDRLHLDFVICDRVSLAPLAVVELDDDSHSRSDVTRRDETKNRALAAAGLGFVRVRVAKTYAREELAKALLSACGHASHTSGPGWWVVSRWVPPK